MLSFSMVLACINFNGFSLHELHYLSQRPFYFNCSDDLKVIYYDKSTICSFVFLDLGICIRVFQLF